MITKIIELFSKQSPDTFVYAYLAAQSALFFAALIFRIVKCRKKNKSEPFFLMRAVVLSAIIFIPLSLLTVYIITADIFIACAAALIFSLLGVFFAFASIITEGIINIKALKGKEKKSVIKTEIKEKLIESAIDENELAQKYGINGESADAVLSLKSGFDFDERGMFAGEGIGGGFLFEESGQFKKSGEPKTPAGNELPSYVKAARQRQRSSEKKDNI